MMRSLLVFAILGLAAPAWPCSVTEPPPSAERLVRDAEVIARVRAESLSANAPVARVPWLKARPKYGLRF